MSTTIDFKRFAHLRDPNGWAVHVVKTTIDGCPSLGIRILFDSEEQREHYIKETLSYGEDDPAAIPEEAS